jgi:hypothetical protein
VRNITKKVGDWGLKFVNPISNISAYFCVILKNKIGNTVTNHIEYSNRIIYEKFELVWA